jgi:hypothetical protein
MILKASGNALIFNGSQPIVNPYESPLDAVKSSELFMQSFMDERELFPDPRELFPDPIKRYGRGVADADDGIEQLRGRVRPIFGHATTIPHFGGARQASRRKPLNV